MYINQRYDREREQPEKAHQYVQRKSAIVGFRSDYHARASQYLSYLGTMGVRPSGTSREISIRLCISIVAPDLGFGLGKYESDESLGWHKCCIRNEMKGVCLFLAARVPDAVGDDSSYVSFSFQVL